MSIRIRHPGGTTTFALGEGADLAALQSFIAQECQIPRSEQEIRTGYPPMALSLHGTPASTLLSDPPLRIRKGEQIIVSVRSSSVSAAPTASRSATASSPSPAPAPAAAPAPALKAASEPQTMSGPSSRKASSSTSAVLAPSDPEKRARAKGSDASAKAAPPAAASEAVKPSTTPSKVQRPTPVAAVATARPSASYTPGVQAGEVVSVTLGPSAPLEGHLTLQVVPDDNSCLFSAVSVLLRQSYSTDSTRELRRLVSSEIIADPESYSEVVLGMPPPDYASRMSRDSTWGGGVELAILSSHYRIELATMDVQNGVMHVFGQGHDYANRGYLVYSGIHYDALALLPEPHAPLEFASTLFDTTTSATIAAVDEAAQQVVQKLKEKRYYTDTARFALKCGQCGTALKGEKEARQHAMQSGHTDFREYE